MGDINSLDSLYLVLGFLVPGFVVLSVRSQFLTGRSPTLSATALSYLTISIIYYALVLPFVDLVLSVQEPGYVKAASWFALIFIGPALFGLFLGVCAQKDLFRNLLQRCGLNPVHVMPTAWDWKFGRMTAQWVLVTLKDGTRFGGLCGSDSFVSSDPSERDIYIQWIYDINDDKKWTARGENGVLITAGTIQTIEFWPYVLQEEQSDG